MAVGAGSSSERSGLENRRAKAKKAAGSKQATAKAAVTFEATFTDEGPLGIVWAVSKSTSGGPDGDSLAAVKAIKPGSVAEESDVAVGMLLGEIGGEDMRGVDYCEFIQCLHAFSARHWVAVLILPSARGSRRDPENPGDQTRDAGLFGRWQSGRKEARAGARAACVDY